MKVLLNGQALQAPLTGIGNYTLNLLQSLQSLPSISAVDCYFNNQFVSAQEVLERLQLLNSVVTPVQPNLKRSVKQCVRALPLAYQARDWLQSHHFRQQSMRHN